MIGMSTPAWPSTRFKLDIGDGVPKRRVEGKGDRNSTSAGRSERIAGVAACQRGPDFPLPNVVEAARGRLT